MVHYVCSGINMRYLGTVTSLVEKQPALGYLQVCAPKFCLLASSSWNNKKQSSRFVSDTADILICSQILLPHAVCYFVL